MSHLCCVWLSVNDIAPFPLCVRSTFREAFRVLKLVGRVAISDVTEGGFSPALRAQADK